jgi:L-lactate dehydrogenase complex protein LldF
VECNNTVLRILREHRVTKLVKSKSMLSEEVHLPSFLRENGIESVETDLGEFIVQIDADHPSLIVNLHPQEPQPDRAELRTRRTGRLHEDPQTSRGAPAPTAAQIHGGRRGHDRRQFRVRRKRAHRDRANEGNARFGIAATPVHIVLVGIEKLLPRDRDLSLFLALIGRSATGSS